MKTPAKLQRQAAEKISHRPRAMCELDEAIDLGIGIDAAKTSGRLTAHSASRNLPRCSSGGTTDKAKTGENAASHPSLLRMKIVIEERISALAFGHDGNLERHGHIGRQPNRYFIVAGHLDRLVQMNFPAFDVDAPGL